MSIRDILAGVASEYEAREAELATAQGTIAETSRLLFEAQARIAALEEELKQYRIPLISGGDLQAALDSFDPGAVLRVEGVFEVSRPVSPKDGQHLVGVAEVRPKAGVSVLDGFDLKATKNVTLEGVSVSGFDRHGVLLGAGSAVVGGRLHDNGKDGAGADLEGRDLAAVTMVECEIDHNGSAEWLGKGAAGVKMFHTRRFLMEDCWVHDNIGNGVWGDAHCGDFTVLGGRIESNTRKGVFYEKCGESDGSFLNRTWAIYTGALTVEGSTIVNNDLDGSPQANAGVSIISSKNARVVGNIFGGNERAITVRDDPARLADDKHGWVPENIVLTDNALNGSVVVGCDLPGVTCSRNA